MRANPGGVLAPEEVVGRDELIEFLWSTLSRQSVVLTSERRIGKTSVIRKMAQACAARGYVCFLDDIEDLNSPDELVERTYSNVEKLLSKVDRAKLGMWRLLEKLGGTHIGDLGLPQIKIHWKKLLNALIDDLLSFENRNVIFFWDELPLFIYNVARNCGDMTAMEVLDSLRALRHKYPRLRMVFTGSVGIHQVIGSLRRSGYANDPTNDMLLVEVSPLSPADGANLAELLLDGEGIASGANRSGLAGRISEATGHIPYYIHCIVARACGEGSSLSESDVDHHIAELFRDPNDPAHFGYYSSRITTYYSDAALAHAILDIVAASATPIAFANLVNLLKHKIVLDEDPDRIRQELNLLQKDHYVWRLPDGSYDFRYSIVKKWWAFARVS